MAAGRRPSPPTVGRLVVAVLVAWVALAAGGACSDGRASRDETGSTAAPVAGTGGVLRLGMVGPSTLDPARAVPTSQADLIVADLLYDGLTEPAPGGVGTRPALAESIEPDDGLRIWTVRLPAGGPASADDVAFSLERVAAAGPSSLAGARLDVVDGYREFAVDRSTGDLRGVEVVDERTVRITLAAPFAQLPDLLASPLYGIVPRTAVGDDGEVVAEPAGTGPFVVERRAEDLLVLAPRPGSSGSERPLGAGGVEIRSYPDLEASYGAFVDGLVDWSLVPAGRVAEAAERFGDRAFAPFGVELWFGINLARTEYQNLGLRRAMLHAVDRRAVVAEALPGARPLDGLVPAGVPGATVAACLEVCRYDPERARALLAEAYPDGGAPPLVLEVYDDPGQRAVADAVRADLETVGLAVTIEVRPFEEYRRSLVAAGQGVFSFGWVGLPPVQDAYLAPLYASGAADNVTGFASPEVDAALAEARATRDPAERERRYAEIERSVLAQVPVLPIAQLVTNQVVSARVSGFEPRTDGTFDVRAVTVAP
jgi:ABC-type transport system substrate-binding protein